jgi:hypothetical protein
MYKRIINHLNAIFVNVIFIQRKYEIKNRNVIRSKADKTFWRQSKRSCKKMVQMLLSVNNKIKTGFCLKSVERKQITRTKFYEIQS